MQGAEIGRRFDQHGIARVQENLAHQVERLLRPVGHQYVVVGARHVEAAQTLGQQPAQGQVALTWPVLQGLGTVGLENPFKGATVFVDWKQLRSRQPARERDDVGLRGDLQNLADVRGAHAFGTVGVQQLPGDGHGDSFLEPLESGALRDRHRGRCKRAQMIPGGRR